MPMKDSRLTDAWIAKMVAANPMMILPNGSIRTGPVRLAFTSLFEARKPGKRDTAGKPSSWGAALLFPPGSEDGVRSVLYPEWLRVARQELPRQFSADGQPFGLIWPVHACEGVPGPGGVFQNSKLHLPGYTKGLYYLDSSSRFQPDVVDGAMNPITDPARGYSGVWAVAVLSPYSYDREKKGVGFGLRGVMLIADDEQLYKPGLDAPAAFAGVSVDQTYDPAAQFGMTPPRGAPALPAGVLPPAVPVFRAPASRTEDLI